MKKSFLLLISIFTAFTLSCQKTKAFQAGFEIPEGQKRDVEVLYVTPEGGTEGLSEVTEILVSFNQPMVPLEGVPEFEKRGPLRISPEIKGRFRWRGTSTLFFIPDEPLIGGTQYVCAVPKGTKSLSGMGLKEDYSWQFTTARPRLNTSKPYHDQQWIELDHKIYLLFNQPMSPDKAKPFIKLLVRDDKGFEKPASFKARSMSKDEEERVGSYWKPERTIVVDPNNNLPIESKVMVKLLEGLPGALGDHGMDTERTVVFHTFNNFRFEGLDNAVQNPQESVRFEFSNPVIYQDFIKHIKFTPDVKIPEHYKNWTHSSTRLYIYLDLKPDTKYKVTIDKELTDRFENKLGEEVTASFKTTDYDPQISLATGRGIVESYSEKRHPVTITNVNRISKKMALLERNEIIPTLLSSDVFYGWSKYTPIFDYDIDEKWTINGERNIKITKPLELGDVLQLNNTGYVFFELDAGKELRNGRRYYRGLLQITDIGISGKFASENNLIWVTTLKDAKPIENAYVELRDDKNRILWQGRTDADGIVETPGWKQLGMVSENRWSKPRIWVFAKKGSDETFIASDEGTGVYPYDFGISYDWSPEPEKYQGYVFTERGIYKSGEDVYIKGILREKYKGKWRISQSVKNIDLTIFNSRDEEIYNKTLSVSNYGSFDIKLPIATDAPTGWYEIVADLVGIDRSFYGSFRVEAYRPAQFEVKVKSDQDEYIFGDEFTGEISGQYLYGGPMSGESVEWTMTLDYSYYTPPGHKGYRFGPSYWYDDDDWEFEGVIGSDAGELDQYGKHKVEKKVVQEEIRRTMLLTLEGSVTAQNRQTLSGRKNCLVHCGEYYIGIKPQKTFIEMKKPTEFEFISTNPKGELVAGKNISIEIIRREWTSVRKAGVEGRYEWITEKKDSIVGKFQIKTDATSVTKSFTPDQTGFYIIKAQGKDSRNNTIVTSTYFYVTGAGYISWRRSDDDRVEITPDEENYKPGDVAKILVKSPYEKTLALVTVEREFILQRFTRELIGSSDVIEIPITEDHLPNIYVSVILLQGRKGFDKFDEKGDDIGKPSFKIGYTNLNVDPGTKHLDITVTTDKEEYKPQDSVTVKLKVLDHTGTGVTSEIVLAVVDVGVLNLIGFQTPDPFPVFYGSRPLSVQTAESRLHIIGQRSYDEKGETRGGGGAAAAPFAYRTEFLTTAYYNARIYTNSKGEAIMRFKLPDNLTTFRLMVTGHTKNSSFGANEANIRVKKPLLLLEALPRFARLGDEFEAGIVVHNNTNVSGEVSVEASADSIELVGENKKSLKILDGQEKEVRFKYRAFKVGKATFRFKVTMGSESDGVELKIPVISPRLTEAVALYNQTTEKASEAVTVPKDIYPDVGYIEFTTSSSALVGLEGGIEYLIKYPYECLEQKTSRILPFILAEDLINSFNLSELKGKDLRKEVQNTLKEYKDFQHYNGGFKFWQDSWYPSPWLTAYVVSALAKANKKGYFVDRTMVNDAIEYLKNVLRRDDVDWEYPYNKNVQLTTKCFILYALVLWDVYDHGYMSRLFEKRDQISLFGKTLLLKAAHIYGNSYYKKELGRLLLNKIKMAPTTAHFEEQDASGMAWIWHSNVRTTALILQAFLETGGEFTNAEKIIKWLVTERKVGRWRSTQENIYVFDAFNTYFNIYEKQTPNFMATVYLENKEIVKEIYKGRDLQMKREEIPLVDLPKDKQLPVNIEKQGTGRLYYGLRMLYAPTRELKPRDEGIAVFKVIEPLVDGLTGDALSAGKVYKVTLSVVTPQERNFVVVDDPLPAGVEVINTSFDTESKQTLKMMSGTESSDQYDDYSYDEDYDDYYDYYYIPWGTFDHWEIYDDKVLLFADALYAGEHTFSYLVRAMTYGNFTMPPTKAEEMYTPEVFGYNRQRRINVK
ncbi:MAG: Ig-like domain-containing protein [bacterium]